MYNMMDAAPLIDSPSSLPPSKSDAVRQQLQRILESRSMGRCNTLKRLFSYIVECSLGSELPHLTEYIIAVDVLGKSSSFDPRVDSLVRVTMRQLRMRLEKY